MALGSPSLPAGPGFPISNPPRAARSGRNNESPTSALTTIRARRGDPVRVCASEPTPTASTTVSRSFVPARPSAPFALWAGLGSRGAARFHGQVHCRRAEDRFLDPADGQRKAPGEGDRSRPGPSVPGSIGGTSGERHSYYKAKGRRTAIALPPFSPSWVSPHTGRRTSALRTMKLRLG
jgi:hypothetical protein